jgi:hypothetical protein
MLDDTGNLLDAAEREIEERTSLIFEPRELANLSDLAVQVGGSAASLDNSRGEIGQDAMHPGVGACDDFIPIMLCQKKLTQQHMEWLERRGEGESIEVKLVPLHEVWKHAVRDLRTLAAITLYHALEAITALPPMRANPTSAPRRVLDLQRIQ